MWSGLVMLCWGSQRRNLIGQSITMWPYSSHSKHLMLGTMPCYVTMFLALETSIFIVFITLTVDGGVMVAVSCCTTLSFSTLDIESLRVCGPFTYMWVAKLWTFLKSLQNILIVAASFMKLHLLASVLNQCTYAARDCFSHCWISMNHEVYM